MMFRCACLFTVGSASAGIPVERLEQIGLLQQTSRGQILTVGAEVDSKEEEVHNIVSQPNNRSQRMMMVQQMKTKGGGQEDQCELLRVTYRGHKNSACVKFGVKGFYDSSRENFLERCKSDITNCFIHKELDDCKMNVAEVANACGRRWCCKEGMENGGCKPKQTKRCHRMFDSLGDDISLDPPTDCQFGGVITSFCEKLKDMATNDAEATLLEIENDEHQNSRNTDTVVADELKLRAGQEQPEEPDCLDEAIDSKNADVA